MKIPTLPVFRGNRRSQATGALGRSPQLASAALVLASLWALALPAGTAQAQSEGPSSSASLYVRSDTDRTTVITPRARVGLPLTEGTTLDVAYMADIWTSASIDIRTSASRNVSDLQTNPSADVAPESRTKPVTERRDELDLGMSQVIDMTTVSGSYRFSSEPDYISHGGSLGISLDMAQRASTLGVRVGGSLDKVGRADDPLFERGVYNLNGRVDFTQILTTSLFAQLIYEASNNHGFLASPYRYVSVGTYDNRCRTIFGLQESKCFAEVVPRDRLRHALALVARQALGDLFSMGATYRFYIDSWDILSHTVMADLAFVPGSDTIVTLGYRFYNQSAASFYEQQYTTLEEGRYYTTDKELSEVQSHRLSLDFEHAFTFAPDDRRLKTMLSVAPIYYTYPTFTPLSSITALEVTVAMVLEL